MENAVKKIMKVRYDQKTWLSGKIAEVNGGFATQGNTRNYCLFFRGNGSAIWTVEAGKEEVFSLKLAYYASTTPARVKLRLGQQSILQTFLPVPGYASEMIPMREVAMMQSPDDCESIDLVDVLTIPSGIHEILLDVETQSEFRVFYLELLPHGAQQKIAEKEREAISQRVSITPLAQSGYGLFIHWTSRTKPRYGSMLTYADAVNALNVERFAEQCAEMGAKYVVFTTDHGSVDFPAPLSVWEKYHPRRTTQRDLVADLITALSKHGIVFFMYMHIPNAVSPSPVYEKLYNFPNEEMQRVQDQENFVMKLSEIFEEIGNRYGKGLRGFWLDGWQLSILKYGVDATERVYHATKIGNPDRMTSFAFGVRCPTLSPWTDYACGETRVIGQLPVNGKYVRGQNRGLPYHSIIVLDDDWWHDYYDTPISDPQYTPDQLAPYLSACRRLGGLVSVNTAVYQDGSVSDRTFNVMRQTASMVYCKP